MTRLFLTLLTVIAVAGCNRTGESQNAPSRPSVLKFTAIPDQNSTELQEKFRPLEQYLSKALGVTTTYVPARDYQASVEMFANGDVALAWYGGLTGVQARNKVPGAKAIAQGDVDAKYFSYFIANRDTGLTESKDFPKDIAKYAFTFGSEQSTSGRLMPEYFIRENTGKSPQEFFGKPVGFSGSHDKTMELVASGQYQVGAVNYKVYDDRVAQKKVDPAVVRIIWRSPTYSDYNWTVRPDLDQNYGAGFTEKLTKALLDINDPTLLKALPRERLIAASNDNYGAIKNVARQLNMLR
jgi:phosphonate transport system substrate-binding protein